MKNALLLLASLTLALLAAEAVVRVLDGYALGTLTLERTGTAPATGEAGHAVTRHLPSVPLAPGVQPAWFAENPPPPASAALPVSPARLAAYREHRARGLPGMESYYVWNRALVEDNADPDWEARFGRLADEVETFTAPGGAPRPVFRFPPGEHLPSGLLTNRHGWRGDDFRHENNPRRVLLAFVGASTTQESTGTPFSHPELVGHWLNRWAESEGLPLRFDIINAGREGQTSRDIAAIHEQEIRPLAPDFLIYLEGANQTLAYRSLIRRPPGTGIPPPPDFLPAPGPLAGAARRSALLARVQELAAGAAAPLTEPGKPAYVLEDALLRTDPVRSGNYAALPLALDVICADLDRIAAGAVADGTRFLLSTYTWLVPEGVPLHPHRHRLIHADLNAHIWPLSYRDWRRLMNYQNEVFRAYAAVRGLGLLDVDSILPHDPDLFVDPIHLTAEGTRLRGWIVFNLLVPQIRAAWERGELPRDRAPGRFDYGPITRLRRPTHAAEPVAKPAPPGALVDLRAAERADPEARIEAVGVLTRVTTGPTLWSVAARLPCAQPAPEEGDGAVLLELDLRVRRGSVGVSLQRFDHPEPFLRQVVTAAENNTTVLLRIEPDHLISHVLLENAAGDGQPSVVDLRATRHRVLPE